jgi:uncharacterized protein
MSQENVEIVRRVYASVGRGVDEGLWDQFSPDFVADWSRRLVDPEVVRGPEQVRSYLTRNLEAWGEGFSIEPDQLIDAGDKVLAFNRVIGRGKVSGAQVEARIAAVWTFREGKPVAMEYFGEDRAAALEAAGLSEQDAHADS